VVDMSSFMQAMYLGAKHCSRHHPHHPFQSGTGNALADVLFGDYNPARPDLGDLVQGP